MPTASQARPVPAALTILLLVCLPAAAHSSPFPLEATRSYPVGMWPYAVATGDLNDDGLPELLTANYLDQVSVLTSDGAGGFDTKPSIPVENSVDVAMGRLDDDGTLDVVTATESSVAISLGNGDNTFKNPVIYGIPNAHAVAIADVTGDGIADVVTANYTDNTASVLVGNGDGSFQAATMVPTGDVAIQVACGDLNADGKSEFIIANYEDRTISVFRFAGNGFTRVDYTVGQSPNDIAIGDVNGDGALDVAVACFDSHAVFVLLNDGSGALGPAAPHSTDRFPKSVAIADLNHDDLPDLVTANGSMTLSVLLGAGLGSFQPRVNYEVGTTADGIAVADLDQDTNMDLAIPSFDNDGLFVFIGDGKGGFTTRRDNAVGDQPRAFAMGDLDGSGLPDIVTANDAANSVTVLINKEGLVFTRADYPAGVGPTAIALGDLTGEGNVDVVTANWRGNTVSILLGNGDGTLQPARNVSLGTGWEGFAVAITDLNRDARPDLAVGVRVGAGGGVSVLLGRGDGTFQTPIFYSVSAPGYGVAVGDVNGDGNVDVATANFTNGVTVQLGNGQGALQLRGRVAVPGSPRGIAMSDLNGDGIQDLITANQNAQSVSVLPGNGTGAFPTIVSYAVNYDPTSVAVGDLDGDNRSDLAVGNQGTGVVSVLRGLGNGTFEPRMDFVASRNPSWVAIGDLDGDGMPDLAATNVSAYTVSVLRKAEGKDGPQITSVESSVRPSGYAPRVSPNPLNPSGALIFRTSRSGAAEVRVFDLRGRMLRRITIPSIPPGDHKVGIGARDMRGQSLASGVYFYSLRTADGLARGRFAIVR